MEEQEVNSSTTLKTQQSSADIVSVAIEINKVTHLRKINQRESLSKIVEDICKEYNLGERENYGLQFDNHAKLGYNFITEENRHEMEDGRVYKIVYSPSYLVQTILGKMVSPGAEENIWSLQKVLSFIHDKSFVEKFVEGEGITILVTILQGNALSFEATGYAFKCLAELLLQGHIPMENIKDRILDKVIHNILSDQKGSSITQESCLSIANSLMEKHAADFPVIYKTISIDRVIPFLLNDNFWVQKTALGLINSIFSVANTLQRKLLVKSYAKQIREIVYKHIILVQKIIPDNMIQQLALFQARFVSRLRRKAESPVDMEDNLVKKRINLLSRLSLKDDEELDTSKRRNTFIETTLTLLSDYVIPPPIDDTSDIPPSILVLDCMTHFIRTYQQNYTRAVLQHSTKTVGSDYPFVQLCTQLIALLTNCLGITTSSNPDEKIRPYYPVLFACDKSFEELFCATIMVFSKTSKEMRAREEDFQKVINVVKKKIEVTLSMKPITLKQFESEFYTVTYLDISRIRQEEMELKERTELREKKSLLQLKHELKPQYNELIKKQRLGVLSKGGYFRYFSKANKIKNKKIHIKYIQNKKLFEFVDEEERVNNFSIDLCKIKNVVVGKNCIHVKLRGTKLKPEFAFSLILTDIEPNYVNLAAESNRQLDHVLDGFKTLLGMDMSSMSYADDLQTLKEMHVRLELLDAYGVELPAGDPPPIPDGPPNYNFL